MRTRDLATLFAVLLAIAAVLVGAAASLVSDRRALVEALEHERKDQLAEASRRFAEDLEDIAEDLRFAASLAHRAPSDAQLSSELGALVEVLGQYKALVVYDTTGARRLQRLDRKAPAVLRGGVFALALDEVARAALQRPGRVVTTPPIEATIPGEYRAFAVLEPGSTRAVAALVDVEPLFAPLRLVASAEDTQLVLLGAHGRPTRATDPHLAELITSGREGLTALRQLIAEMRDGEAGCRLLPADEAVQLDLADAEVVACHQPIRVAAAEPWAVATLTSTRTLAARQSRLLLRLGLATTALVALLALVAATLVVSARRTLQLRETERQAEELSRLHARTRRILDSLPTGVVAFGRGGEVVLVNRALRERGAPDSLGQRDSGVSGAASTLADVFPLAPAGALATLQQLAARAETLGEPVSLFGEQVALFGSEGHYNVHAVPLGQAGQDIQRVLVLEDTSKVNLLESQLVRAEKLATIGVLAAGIAHEVGTPLGVVRGRAEFVAGKLGANHPQAAGLRIIVEQIDRVARTLRQLLDFSRVQPAAVRAVHAGPLLEAVVELLRLEAQRRGVSLSAAVAPALPALAADPDALQQVLVNLALNALDASRRGGKVELGAGAGEPGRVRLTVRDDGAGIPMEQRAQVFDPFFTTKKRGQGTGLGLTIVSQIARNHGAAIDLDSEEGRGTVVTLSWPAATADGTTGPTTEGTHAPL